MLDDTTQVRTMTLTSADTTFERLSFPNRHSVKPALAAEDGTSGYCAWSDEFMEERRALEAGSDSLRERLAGRVDQLCRFARSAYEEIDAERLANAQNEANVLIYSGVFSETLSPEVCIDLHGEISFTHKSDSGYLDIGVRGDGELSYHVRNDKEPLLSAHADHVWQDYKIPMNLRESLRVLAG